MRNDPERESYERQERALDPHRAEEQDAAAVEVSDRLRRRGVSLTGRESGEELVNLLDSVERFEREVEYAGGDLMVDSGNAAEPDDPAFVLPKRVSGEPIDEYLGRIDDAAQRIHRRDRPRG